MNNAALRDAMERVVFQESVHMPPTSEPRRLLQPVDVAGVISNPSKPPRFVWDQYLPREVVTLLGAHGGTGKSMVALMLSVCVATGRPLFEVDTEPGRVLFASLEDSAAIVRYRLAWICRQWGIDPATLSGSLRIVDGTGDPELYAATQRNGGEVTPTYVELASLARDADLVIVDNASDAYGGDEIQRRQVRAFIRSLADIAVKSRGAVLLLAHVDKNTSRQRKAEGGEGYSGSTAWHNTVRSRLFMTRNDDGTLTLEHQKGNHSEGLRDPVTLEWPKGELPCVRQPLSPVVQGITDRADTKALLKLIHEYTERGEYVSTATNSPTNIAKLAQEQGHCIKRKRKEIFNLVRDAQRDGYLERDLVRTRARSEKEVWRVTDAGQAFALIGAATAGSAASVDIKH